MSGDASCATYRQIATRSSSASGDQMILRVAMLASRPPEDAVDVKLPAFTAVERALASGQVRTKRAQFLNVGQQFPTDRFSIRLGQPGHLGYCIIKDFGHAKL